MSGIYARRTDKGGPMPPEFLKKGRGRDAPQTRFLCMPSSSKEPWEKPAPKKSSHTKLTPARKAAAKRDAKKAGRKYPCLVDNMNAARKQRALEK